MRQVQTLKTENLTSGAIQIIIRHTFLTNYRPTPLLCIKKINLDLNYLIPYLIEIKLLK